ncbi:hypothetical protein [Sulfitobacter sp. JB4-11]|uniref:hypothetical protein n=1 Tax=Sulfitobacter rhodophyticola TaxID=3238304 RepID=UPI003D81360B
MTRPATTPRPAKRGRDLVVMIVGATVAPGPDLTEMLARRGARLVVLDRDGRALEQLAGRCGGRIEPLALPQDPQQTMTLLRSAWGHEPLDLVVNLAPLAASPDTGSQITALSYLVRATARGLVAARGCLVTVMARPEDALDLQATGLCAALAATSTALGQALGARGVRVHSISVPAKAPQQAVSLLSHLAHHRLDDIPATAFSL